MSAKSRSKVDKKAVASKKAEEKGPDGENLGSRSVKRDISEQVWYKPVMFGLLLIGLVWVIIFYLSNGMFPIGAWGNWNIFAGFALILLGFVMTTKWK